MGKLGRLRVSLWRATFVTLYAMFALAYYFATIKPYVENEDSFAPKLLADTFTYLQICQSAMVHDSWYWLRDVGPCITLYVFDNNFGMITIFNAILLVLSTKYAANSFSIKTGKFFILLAINPLIFLSLFGPNKELYGVCSILFFLAFLQTQSKLSLLTSIILASLTRYSTLFALVILLPFLFLNFDEKRKKRATLMGAIFLTIVSAIAPKIIGDINFMLGEINYADNNSSATNISLTFDSFSQNGLFFVTFLFRIILNFFSALINLSWSVVATHGVYYGVGVTGSSLLFLVLILHTYIRHKGKFLSIQPSAPHIWLFFVIFCAVHTISPVIQHRYFLPLYPILVAFSLSKRSRDYFSPAIS